MTDYFYAIGDIHGSYDLLVELIEKIQDDASRHDIENPTLVFIGDYVDRGKKSKEVIEALSTNVFLPDWPKVFLCGNHEYMMIEAERDVWLWLNNGGWATVDSYDPDLRLISVEQFMVERFLDLMPEHHMRWLQQLRLYHRAGPFLFVHAGIKPGVPLKDQEMDDLLWIRDPFLRSTLDHGFRVIHGHTPQRSGVVEEVFFNRINVDSGAFFSGRLSAVVLNTDNDEVRVISADYTRRPEWARFS